MLFAWCRKYWCRIDGDYVKWDGIRKYYSENEEQILASFNEECELVEIVDSEAI